MKCSDITNKLLHTAEKLDTLTKETAATIHQNENYMLVVGENISVQLLTNYGLIEFEDYIYEKYLQKKIAILYGNCHTTVISEILNQCPEFNRDYRVYEIKPIHTISSVAYFDEPIFKYCDDFIHQSIQKGNRYGEEYS